METRSAIPRIFERIKNVKSVVDNTESTSAFCIYINTLIEGVVPSVWTDTGLPLVYKTRHEAEIDIAELMMDRLQEFMDGNRDFDDAMTVEEYIVEVGVFADGSIGDEDGNYFTPRIKTS